MSDMDPRVAGDPDYQVGALLLELATRFANAWADGHDALGARWADVAFRIRGRGEYRDTDRDLKDGREVER